jgi:hypothetical protein
MQEACLENGSTRVASILTRIYYIRMEVIDNDQYCSLLQFRINYCGKNIVVQALRRSHKYFTSVTIGLAPEQTVVDRTIPGPSVQL